MKRSRYDSVATLGPKGLQRSRGEQLLISAKERGQKRALCVAAFYIGFGALLFAADYVRPFLA